MSPVTIWPLLGNAIEVDDAALTIHPRLAYLCLAEPIIFSGLNAVG